MAQLVVSHLNYDTDLLVADLARRHTRRRRDRDAVAIVMGTQRVTWGELDVRITRLTDALARHGVVRGDRVGLFMRNRVEYFEIVLALAAIGAAAVPQSFRSTAEELVRALDITGVKLLFVDIDEQMRARAEDAVSRCRAATSLITLGAEYESLLARGTDDDWVPRPNENDAIWFAATGGTTGNPKLVRVTHRVLVQMWLFMVVELGIRRDDVMLLAGPLYHGLGFGFALQQLYVGGRVIVMNDFDPASALQLIETESVTVLPAVPTMLNLMLASDTFDTTTKSTLRLILSSGAAMLPTLKERVLARLPETELFETYGATEAGFFTVLYPEDQPLKPRSCGVAFFGTAIRVLDPAGRDRPTGQVGLVYKRGLIEGGGYANDAEATAAMFHDGWCQVGDLGYLDDDGYLYLVDRQKDMIVSGGVNIYPAEIEAAIAVLPEVLEVAVIGRPDDVWGELIAAYVVARPGATITAAAVIAACTDRLADFKKPRVVEFIDSMPKSPAGKILKRELRAAAAASDEA